MNTPEHKRSYPRVNSLETVVTARTAIAPEGKPNSSHFPPTAQSRVVDPLARPSGSPTGRFPSMFPIVGSSKQQFVSLKSRHMHGQSNETIRGSARALGGAESTSTASCPETLTWRPRHSVEKVLRNFRVSHRLTKQELRTTDPAEGGNGLIRRLELPANGGRPPTPGLPLAAKERRRGFLASEESVGTMAFDGIQATRSGPKERPRAR